MKYLLDTNICIYLIKHHPPEVLNRFSQLYYGSVGISTITLAELRVGVEKSAYRTAAEKALEGLLEELVVKPFEAQAAIVYGKKRLEDPDRRKNAMDRLIASHAVALGCILVTNNPKDFVNYSNLKVESWVEG